MGFYWMLYKDSDDDIEGFNTSEFISGLRSQYKVAFLKKFIFLYKIKWIPNVD